MINGKGHFIMKKLGVIVISALIGVAGLPIQSLADASWTTEWTSPDGGKNKTQATFYDRTRSDGRVGHYGWSNGRFIGSMMDGGARFEGKWIQDKSGQRCNRSVNGSHYYGSAWFETQGGERFAGGWNYCDASPNLGWRGWR